MALTREVTAFLQERVSSLSELELLLLLHSEAQHTWTARSASATLQLTESWVAAEFEQFVADGFARRVDGPPPGYRWSLADGRLAATVEQVAAAYESRRTRVITCIYGSRSATERAVSEH